MAMLPRAPSAAHAGSSRTAQVAAVVAVAALIKVRRLTRDAIPISWVQKGFESKRLLKPAWSSRPTFVNCFLDLLVPVVAWPTWPATHRAPEKIRAQSRCVPVAGRAPSRPQPRLQGRGQRSRARQSLPPECPDGPRPARFWADHLRREKAGGVDGVESSAAPGLGVRPLRESRFAPAPHRFRPGARGRAATRS